ncbi:glycosyltransferase family 2 protein [Agromyces sp. CCNWLW203]|uniref:glycosyltransferase family 2 protein n=1 Tax=Agromyces sp. CCNWLW203 TaxID=3112842 RepID=UPI002F965D55
MTTKPSHKVGVFMPCFNLGEYVEEAVESLYAQTFQDFHLLLADDASTDARTVEVVERISRPRCDVHFETDNLGLVEISNKYMQRLDAEYIVLFNADDRLHPEFLDAQVAYLDAHPEIAAVSVSVQEFGDSDNLIEYDDSRSDLPFMLVENRFSGAALMRKNAWLAAGMHDPDPDLYPNLDYDLWLSMLAKGMKLGTIPQALFYWRVRKSSLSHDMDAERMRVFRRALLRKYSDLYREHAEFVTGFLLDELARFEQFYLDTTEAKAWLVDQYETHLALSQTLSEEVEVLKLQLAATRPSLLAKVATRLRG